MKAWFQFPNFESKDLEFSVAKEAIKYWNSVDKLKLDKMQDKLDSGGEDNCPWGLALLTTTDTIHIYRNGIMSDTFDISLTTVVNEKLLGLINRSRQVDEIRENIPSENIHEYITNFFENKSFPEGNTPKATQKKSSNEPDSNVAKDVPEINNESKHLNQTPDRKKWFFKKVFVLPTLSIVLIALIFRSCSVDQTLPDNLVGTYYGEVSETGDLSITLNKDGTYRFSGITGNWKIKRRAEDSYLKAFELELILADENAASDELKEWLSYEAADGSLDNWQTYYLYPPGSNYKPYIKTSIRTQWGPKYSDGITTDYYFKMR